jgi:lipopolysaccharide/colanic/teichoic acid biosynthesis glycosyltransferase
LGLILPDIPASIPAFPRELDDRIRTEILRRVDAQTAKRISIRLHVCRGADASYPEGLESFEPVVFQRRADGTRRPYHVVAKRALDVVLSVTLFAVLSPLLLVTAALVKLTSRGPVLFRQERVGHMMKPFTMLKFRTMHVNVDDAIHREFVSAFINSGGQAVDADNNGLFKIVDDPRATRIGRVLRRLSLDELPQLWNVIRGDMSLVGPRPPLCYEVEHYKVWHRRRLMEAKPGITGLWQVTGRSRTTFDEMVRLDLRYAKSNSVWTDIKILLATPRAVISGNGAC